MKKKKEKKVVFTTDHLKAVVFVFLVLCVTEYLLGAGLSSLCFVLFVVLLLYLADPF